MGERKIIETALENLQKYKGIHGEWIPENTQYFDGKLNLYIDNQHITFYAQVKKELRVNHLQEILKHAIEYKPYMVITQNRIFDTLTLQLQENRIAFLEGNGNLYFDVNQRMIWINLNNPYPKITEKINRAFTKTGLKVIFHFLTDPTLINKTYREIAELTGVALGNINYIMTGLKNEGFLITLRKNEYKLTRQKELFEKWIDLYHQRLKPTLKIGEFKFINAQQNFNWKEIKLNPAKTFWGGEAAGDILTNYLNAAELTLYTNETKQDLITNLKIIPAEKGNILIYKKFWNTNIQEDTAVPPLLAYADLIYNNDRRYQETAEKIYNEYLQDKF